MGGRPTSTAAHSYEMSCPPTPRVPASDAFNTHKIDRSLASAVRVIQYSIILHLPTRIDTYMYLRYSCQPESIVSSARLLRGKGKSAPWAGREALTQLSSWRRRAGRVHRARSLPLFRPETWKLVVTDFQGVGRAPALTCILVDPCLPYIPSTRTYPWTSRAESKAFPSRCVPLTVRLHPSNVCSLHVDTSTRAHTDLKHVASTFETRP